MRLPAAPARTILIQINERRQVGGYDTGMVLKMAMSGAIDALDAAVSALRDQLGGRSSMQTRAVKNFEGLSVEPLDSSQSVVHKSVTRCNLI